MLLLGLMGEKGIDGVSPRMAGHMQSPYSAMSHLQFLINSQRVRGSLHEIAIMLADDYLQIGAATLLELLVEMGRLSRVVPVFVGVEHMGDGVLGKAGAQEGEHHCWIGWVDQH